MKLLPTYFKWIGLAGYIIAGVLISNYAFDLDDVEKPTGLILQLLTLLSLVLIIFSKQRVEDEFVIHKRLQALQISILIIVLLRIFFKSLAFWFQDTNWMPQFQINFLLLVYIIVFHILQIVIPYISQKLSKEKAHEE